MTILDKSGCAQVSRGESMQWVKLLCRMNDNPESESSKTCPNNKFLVGMETLTFHTILEGWRLGFEMALIKPRP